MGILTESRAAIEGRWSALWDNNAVPTRYQNVAWKQPAQPPFCHFNVNWGLSDTLDIGSSKCEVQTGTVTISLRTALGAGTEPILTLADAAMAVFRNQQLTNGSTKVDFFDGNPSVPTEMGNVFAMNVNMRFKAERRF